MVRIAGFLCGQAQDMAGKMVGISFPIAAFVAIGFDHIPADMLMMPPGLRPERTKRAGDALQELPPYHA